MRKCIILSLLCLVSGAVFASTGASGGCVDVLPGQARVDSHNFEIGVEFDKEPYSISG